MMTIRSLVFFSLAIASGQAFVFPTQPPRTTTTTTALQAYDAGDSSILDTIQTSFKIAMESNGEGYGFKQVVADVLAGEFDRDAVSQTIEETVASAPCGKSLCRAVLRRYKQFTNAFISHRAFCGRSHLFHFPSTTTVMYTWESSPSCKKAVEAFAVTGAQPKIVRLDDPWEEGNPVRATLGRMVGRTSVPFVFVGGTYIGGFDGGLEGNPDASGMVDLAFQGKLREMLNEAGAL
jgi:glutaredoxin